jgi:hypothetical protein
MCACSAARNPCSLEGSELLIFLCAHGFGMGHLRSPRLIHPACHLPCSKKCYVERFSSDALHPWIQVLQAEHVVASRRRHRSPQGPFVLRLSARTLLVAHGKRLCDI